MINFIARKDGVGSLKLLADNYVFGHLKDCEATWLFECNDEMVEQAINAKLEGDMSISEMLVVVKEVYTGFVEMWEDESRAEAASERAFYNTIEYDAEAQEEMYRDDMKCY